MMTRRDLLGGFALSWMAISLAGCEKQLPTIRYRLTVEVETPQGLRTGSSVIEVQTRDLGKGFPGPEAGGVRQSVRGEAVAVDLPGGQTLFALLSSPNDSENAARIMGYAMPVPEVSYPDPDAAEHNLEALSKSRGIYPVKPKRYPMLVRFKDIRDPKTVEVVDPAKLGVSFGAGVKLRRVTVEITDDPVTSGIEKRLGWPDRLNSYRTDPKNPFSNTLPSEIGGLRSK